MYAFKYVHICFYVRLSSVITKEKYIKRVQCNAAQWEKVDKNNDKIIHDFRC